MAPFGEEGPNKSLEQSAVMPSGSWHSFRTNQPQLLESARLLNSMLHLPKLKTEKKSVNSKRDNSNESMLSWKKGARDGYALEY